jgi:type III secretion protein Q
MHDTGHTELLEDEESFADEASFGDEDAFEGAELAEEGEPTPENPASFEDAEEPEPAGFTDHPVDTSSAEFPTVELPAAIASDNPELARFLKRGCHTAVPALEAEAFLQLRVSDAADADWSGALFLRGAFGTLQVAQGTRLLRALSGIDLDGEQGGDSARWNWMQAAVLGRLSNTPLQVVEAIDLDADTDISDISDAVTAVLSLQSGTHAIHAYIRADAVSLLAFLRAGQWQPVRPPLSELLGLRCEAAVCVARHTLPANVLTGITAGDIFVPDSPRFASNGEGALRVGPMQMRVRYEAPGLLTVTALEDNMHAVDDNDYLLTEEDLLPAALAGEGGFGGPIDPARLAELEATELTLDFELGKVSLPLGELRALGVGSILPFDGGSPTSITIVSAGWTLGQGELVEVDGQLAVRITHWSTEE